MKPDYRFSDYPLNDPDVRLIEDVDDEDQMNVDFGDYLEWLSKYLSTLPLKPDRKQAKLSRELRQKSPEVAIRSLAIYLGIADAVDEPHYDPSFEIESVWPHPVEPPVDFGYRVALAIILDPVKEQKARCELLRLFYGVYQDEVCK